MKHHKMETVSATQMTFCVCDSDIDENTDEEFGSEDRFRQCSDGHQSVWC